MTKLELLGLALSDAYTAASVPWPNAVRAAWDAAKTAEDASCVAENGGQETNRPCTCHLDDSPPVPCQHKYALTHCLLAEARADAARYRFLRGDTPPESSRWPRWNIERWNGAWCPMRGAELDAAIDAALAAQKD